MATLSGDQRSIRNISYFAREIAGNVGAKIVKSLGDGVTDEKIEQKTSLKIPEIRSTLNKLHNFGIVEYTREKNAESGWYTYTWKLNIDRALRNFLSFKKKEYEELLRKANSLDGAVVYECRKGCIGLPFDAAIERNFSCPKCGSVLKCSGKERDLEKLEEKIRAVEKILGRFSKP
jgi:transcription initiation factor TFIIE subunit alpha